MNLVQITLSAYQKICGVFKIKTQTLETLKLIIPDTVLFESFKRWKSNRLGLPHLRNIRVGVNQSVRLKASYQSPSCRYEPQLERLGQSNYETYTMTTVWEALNTPLPQLVYDEEEVSSQAKGSTKWAAHSATPSSVVVWDDFDQFIEEASELNDSIRVLGGNNVASRLATASDVANTMPCKQEEDVTNRTQSLLAYAFAEVSDELDITTTTKYTVSDPDIVIARKNHLERRQENVITTFETKPKDSLSICSLIMSGRFVAYGTSSPSE